MTKLKLGNKIVGGERITPRDMEKIRESANYSSACILDHFGLSKEYVESMAKKFVNPDAERYCMDCGRMYKGPRCNAIVHQRKVRNHG